MNVATNPHATMLEAALHYAELGFRVAPFHYSRRGGACSCKDGAECPKPGKHPRIKDWMNRATADRDQIIEWWSHGGNWAYSNITIATGSDSNLIVLDFDGHEGLRTYRETLSRWGLPQTPTAKSGGGGIHVWLRHPRDGRMIPSGNGLLGPRADVKADDGAITVPPSMHKSGRPYTWTEQSIYDTEIAEAPEWLIEMIVRAHETGEPAISETSSGEEYRYRRPRQAVRGEGNWERYELPEIILEGDRNDELYRYGCSLWAQGKDASELEALVSEANDTRCASGPLSPREIEWILRSVMSHPQGQPRQDQPIRHRRRGQSFGLVRTAPDEPPPEPPPFTDDEIPPELLDGGDEGGGPPDGGGGDDGGGGGPRRPAQVILLGPDGIPMTDVGQSQRVYRDHGDNMRYIPTLDRWYVWSGTHWEHDELKSVRRLVAVTARAMHGELAKCVDEDAEKAWRRHVKSSESAQGIKNTLSCLSMHRAIARRADNLDEGTEDLLVTTTGVVNLRTLEVSPHTREPMITKIAACEYDPKAKCPTFMNFLSKIMLGDDEMVSFLQRAIGYTLTGSTAEQCLFFLHGTGQNGKSTLMECIREMMGDYGTAADFSTFMEKHNDNMRADVARIRGARLVTASEPNRNQKFSESSVKLMTGGEKVSCRHLYGDFFEYLPAYKIWLSANHLPPIKGQDDGIWRRFRLIPFEYRVPDNEKDGNLPRKLRAEWPGILAWAVQGAAEWYRSGLNPPAKVSAATNEYRSDMDVIGSFVAECLYVAKPGEDLYGLAAHEVYNIYLQWCERSGERAMPARTLGVALTERGYKSTKRGGKMLYVMFAKKIPDAPGSSE